MVFKSRISVFLVVMMTVIIVMPFVTIPEEGFLVTLAAIAPVVLIIVVLFASLRYVIDGNVLYVRSFPFTRGTAYDLTKLKSISPTRSLLSSPALSMKRIKLDFGVGMPLIISPRGQEVFIEEILRVNPNVEVNL